MAAEDTILSVESLRVTFAGDASFTAVNNISFSVAKGKTLAIVGESGSGKSLTVLALMGLLPAIASSKGNMLLKNLSLTIDNLQSIRGKEIGMVFQEPMSSLNPVMSVGKQLAEAILVHQKMSRAEAKKLAVNWFGKVQLPEPTKMFGRYPHQLSGGQRQRVMIAMAMCNHPALLIADEPTTALDTTVQQEIMRLMHYLQQEHQSAMIFITHDLALAGTIADDVLVMRAGEVVEYGSVSQILKHPQHAYTQALIACRPSPDHKEQPLPVMQNILNNIGKTGPQPVLTPQLPQSSEPLLTVKELSVWFPEHKKQFGKPRVYIKAVDNVSFTLNKGEILGLVGESGCGKSTLSKTLVGLIPPRQGEILYNDVDLAKIPIREWTSVRRQIQMIFQDPYSSLNPRMTIGDALTEPLMVHQIVPKHELQKEALRLLDIVQLPADAYHRYPHQFSGGQRQRIGIARALALQPQLLICDECVSSLDVSIQAQILNLLKSLQQEFNLTYLFISHDLSVVHYMSDRVMVMEAGKIVESGTAEQVLKQPQNKYTQKLVDTMPLFG